MRNQNEPTWADGCRYFFRNMKMGWERNGGKICTIVGTTGLFLSGMHACRTTYKYHDELMENGRRISEAAKKRRGEKGYQRALRVIKETAKCTAKSSKHYAADIVGGALSAYASGKGWNKEHQHYEDAAMMVGVLAADFMNYRSNVISDLGKDADLKYLTTKKTGLKTIEHISGDGKDGKDAGEGNENAENGIVIQMDPNMLKIKYSRETTPMVWSESYTLRINHLEDIRNTLNGMLIYGGWYTVNDVRREFYGKKGDVAAGGIFGRVWEPGNPEHPEKGRYVDLHYEDDEAFMHGEKDWCWIYIEIDEEPLIETLGKLENPMKQIMHNDY